MYRVELASNAVYQITRLATGVSGITALSPTMSVAQRSGRILFSVFENSGYNVYGLDPENARGTRVEVGREPSSSIAGLLPPVEAYGSGMVAEYLADASTGLPPVDVQYEVEDYKPRLALDFLGQPQFGVGANRFGPAISGGVSAYFSDMLGDHQLAGAIQAQGTFKDIGAQVLYRNSENKLNWAVSAGHVPYLTGRTFVGRDPSTGYQRVDQYLERVFVDQVTGYAFLPQSTTRRFEFNAGFTRLGFDREVISYIVSPSGQIVDQLEEDLNAPGALNLIEGAAAMVGDNAHFGFTSPVVGQRYRFEISPTFGTLTYQTALADYRRYFFAQPVTFAVRGIHYGRYGSDANSPRMSPLFLGYETFVRGYAVESFTGDECSQSLSSQRQECPEFDRLIGSRLAVFNAEVRVPLFGVEGLGLINMPFLPTEISAFVDAGLAWYGSDAVACSVFTNGDDCPENAIYEPSEPRLAFDRNTTDRVPVVSTGVSARVNILGYLILEAYYAYPFQRPEKGAHWGFNLAPGW